MSDTQALRHIYNACDPLEPAAPEYYLDCSGARGSSALCQQFQRQLALADDHLCFLFSGHWGCGKSSELHQLRHALLHPGAEQDRYFPVLLDASEYLDDYDVSSTDILLAVVAELADAFRSQLGVELRDNYFVKRFNEIKGLLISDVDPTEGELPLWGAKIKFQRLRSDPDARHRVRETLAPRTSSLLQEMNTVFEEARLRLKELPAARGEKPYKDFVLIIDSLERIQRVQGSAEGMESLRELFIERAPQLTSLNAHIIYTVPLRLARADGPQLQAAFGIAPFVLPMIKVIERDRTPYDYGTQCLRDIVQRRLGPDTALEAAFAPGALDFLLTYSGGHVRNLMLFIQNACTHTLGAGLPITLEGAYRAVEPTVTMYSTTTPERHWEKLAALDLAPDQKIPGDDPDYFAMLENLSVLEYINGGGEGSPFTVAAPWYGVNPVARELSQFQAARDKLRPGTP